MIRPVPSHSSHCTFARHQHAYAIENLLPFLQPGAKVLDAGSSAGYLCAVFHHLIKGNGGHVVGIEHIPEIFEWSKENMINGGLGRALENGDIEMFLGDCTLGEHLHIPVTSGAKRCQS